MSGQRLKVAAKRCVGCRICELACSMSHFDGAFNPRNALIRVESNRASGINKPVSLIDRPYICRQCMPTPWAEACPVEAITISNKLSIPIIDPDVCTGCRQCVEACPFSMIIINEDTQTAMKCDLCGKLDGIDTDQCPLYLLTGEYDFSCMPEDTLRTAETIPGVKVEVMKEVGHFPMSENSAQFRKYIIPVLEDIRKHRWANTKRKPV